MQPYVTVFVKPVATMHCGALRGIARRCVVLRCVAGVVLRGIVLDCPRNSVLVKVCFNHKKMKNKKDIE